MLSRILLAIPILLLPPAAANAQAEPYLHVLTIPPQTVGTCVNSDVVRHSAAGDTRTVTLVIEGIDRVHRREIILMTDLRGNPLSYADDTFAPTASGGEGENVAVVLDKSGHAHGFRGHRMVRMSPPDMKQLDTASLRKMRENAIGQSTLRPLDPVSARQAEKFIRWLRQRCPPVVDSH